MAADNPLTKASFHDGSYHFPPRAPSASPKTCSFYNTSTCLKGTNCKFNHNPDDRSLRLVLNGPNICKNHLLAEKGCSFAKKGRKCWYSHDLSKAGLPLHDKELLKKTLVQLEAQVQDACRTDWWTIEQAKRKDKGKVTKAEEESEDEELDIAGNKEAQAWMSEMQERADKILADVKGGGKVENPYEGKVPVVEVKGLSGADVLRVCGVHKPFAALDDRKKLKILTEELMDDGDSQWEDEYSDDDFGDDDFGFGGGPFSQSDMMELASQGVKPWDDDAADVLAYLSGGF